MDEMAWTYTETTVASMDKLQLACALLSIPRLCVVGARQAALEPLLRPEGMLIPEGEFRSVAGISDSEMVGHVGERTGLNHCILFERLGDVVWANRR